MLNFLIEPQDSDTCRISLDMIFWLVREIFMLIPHLGSNSPKFAEDDLSKPI